MAIFNSLVSFFDFLKFLESLCDKKLMKINQKAELPLENLSVRGNGWLYKCA